MSKLRSSAIKRWACTGFPFKGKQLVHMVSSVPTNQPVSQSIHIPTCDIGDIPTWRNNKLTQVDIWTVQGNGCTWRELKKTCKLNRDPQGKSDSNQSLMSRSHYRLFIQISPKFLNLRQLQPIRVQGGIAIHMSPGFLLVRGRVVWPPCRQSVV